MAKQLPLEVVLEKLSQYLKQAPPHRRIGIAAMLSSLVHDPEDYELLTQVLMLMMQPKTKPEAKPKHLRMVQGGDAS